MTADDYTLDSTGIALDDDDDRDEVSDRKAVESLTRQFATPGAKPDPVAHESKQTDAPLYFDLETVPDYERLESFGLEPVPEVPPETAEAKCPDPQTVVAGTVAEITGTLRKLVAPEKWLLRLEEAETVAKNRDGVFKEIDKCRAVRQTAMDAHDDRRKLLSTTPEYCRIAAISFAIGGADTPTTWVSVQPNGEELLIRDFWARVAGGGGRRPLVGFNILHFDIPVILVRSAILGIPTSRMLDLRPFSREVIDLYLLRFGPRGNTDKNKPGKLKELAKLYGIAVGEEGVDGSQVEELLKTDPQKLGRYCASDVQLVQEFHRRLRGYFWV